MTLVSSDEFRSLLLMFFSALNHGCLMSFSLDDIYVQFVIYYKNN